MPKEVEVTANATTKCPFCEGTYTLTNNGDGEGTPAAFHSMPACKKFMDLDILDFAIAARKAMGVIIEN